MAASFPVTATFGTNGNFDDDGNWNGTHPSTGAFNVTTPGGNDITSGLDQTLSTFTRVSFQPDFDGSIGTGSTDLALGMAAGGTPGANSLLYRGGGEAAYFADEIEDIIVDTTKRGPNAFHYGNSAVGTSTAARFYAQQGLINIDANATITDLFAWPVLESALELLVNTGATVVRFDMLGGNTEWSGSGGTPTMRMKDGIFNHNAGTVTTTFLGGGVYKMKAGTSSTIHAGDGLLDFSEHTGLITIGQIFQGRRKFKLGTNPNFSDPVDVLVVQTGEHGLNVGDTYQLT